MKRKRVLVGTFLAQEPGLRGTPRAEDVVGGTKTPAALF